MFGCFSSITIKSFSIVRSEEKKAKKNTLSALSSMKRPIEA